jgi:predicted lipoprotein with Yx(FWY)xxD motif
MTFSRIALALLGGTAAIAAGGCVADNGPSASGYRAAPAPIRSQANVQRVPDAPYYYRTHQTAAHGTVYVNMDGQALYYYRRDRMNQSTCYGDCARNWRPYLAQGDVRPHGNWSIIDRDDGTRQWVYSGRPTYTWTGDREPGVVTGDGYEGSWSVMVAPQP